MRRKPRLPPEAAPLPRLSPATFLSPTQQRRITVKETATWHSERLESDIKLVRWGTFGVMENRLWLAGNVCIMGFKT